MSCSCRQGSSNTTSVKRQDSVAEAKEIGLKQCYECAKKHLSRAKEEFKEYHLGYPEHIKNLIQSVRVAENDVREAFLKWNEIQAQLDMSSGELLGRDYGTTVHDKHLEIAQAIRSERLKLSNNPRYIPMFDDLLVAIQQLE